MHSADSIQTLAMERTSDSAGSAVLATSGPKESHTARPGIRVRASKIWAEARQEASADLKAVRCLRAGFWFLFVVWFGLIIAIINFLAVYSTSPLSGPCCDCLPRC